VLRKLLAVHGMEGGGRFGCSVACRAPRVFVPLSAETGSRLTGAGTVEVCLPRIEGSVGLDPLHSSSPSVMWTRCLARGVNKTTVSKLDYDV